MSKLPPVGERQMSFFLNAFATKESLPITVAGLIDNIRSDVYAERIHHIRSITDKDAKDAEKKKLPAVTVSGRFPSIRKDAEMQEPTYLIAVDIDKIDEHGHDIDTLKSLIACDPYVYALFETVSGNGLCAIVEYKRGSDHRHVYLSLDEYFNTQYKVSIDSACKNESRIRFLCHDPNIHVNNDARVFEPPKKPRNQRQPAKSFIASDDDFRHVAEQIIRTRIDITGTYAQWRDISFAIADGMGESGREVFHAISQFHPEYDERKCDLQYTRAIHAKGSGITRKTFFHHAKLAGLETTSPRTKKIAQVASLSKRSMRPAEEAIKTLEAEDIPPEISKPIVERIYTSDEPIDIGLKQDDVIKMVIKRYADIRYNEILQRYEIDGKQMDTRLFNSLYVYVRKQVEGRPPSSELIRSIIESDFIPTYNPVAEFCDKAPKKYDTDKPKIIKELADCLELDGQDHHIALQYICLWLVGMAELWTKGEPNPHMLMITGKQQGTGKTTFFRKLLPKEFNNDDYYAEIKITGSKDDALLSANKLIIMVDEMAGLGKTDWDWIKQVITQKHVTARPAYGRYTVTLPRITSWAGTSNQTQLLRDRTGTRRFLPLRIKSINREKFNAINKSALFWEAIWLCRNGWTTDLSIEEYNKINENNEQFAEVSIEEELISRYYAPVDSENDWLLVKKTAGEIFEYIDAKTNGIHRMLNAVKIGRTLSQMGYENSPKWHNNKTQRIYSLKERP
jgi:hypothetical protein